MESGLYIVSTPIGNLADITYRAVHVLNHVSCVYAEDTRRTRKLFSALGITKPLISCHAHNEVVRKNEIVEKIQSGNIVAIVSDAGTPSISDPGNRLIASVIEEGIRVIPIPGPSAVLPALIGSGFDISTFCFIGFLPTRTLDRQRKLELFEDVPAPLIIFVAPSNLLSVLQSCIEVFGESRKCTIAKEITKIYECFDRGSLKELWSRYQPLTEIKGEYTLVIDKPLISEIEISDDQIRDLLSLRFDKDSLSEAVKQVSSELGVRKKRVYKLALSLKRISL